MSQILGIAFRVLLLLAVAFAMAPIGGCGGKSGKNAGDNVADEVTGHRPIQQGNRLKDQVRKIDEQRQEQEKKAETE
jgi:hypothetical protein